MSNFEVLTSNGFKDFDKVVCKGTKNGITIKTQNHSISVTLNHKFFIKGTFVYANELRVGDEIQTENGLEKITQIEETKDDFYDLINVRDGHHFTANGIEVSNCGWMASEKFQALLDSVLPAQGAMSWKKNVFISTPNGMNHFYDLVEGSRKRKIVYGLNKEQIEKLKETETILKETESSPGIFDVTIDKPSNNMALFEMDWREVPRFDSKGNRLDPEAFKEDIIAKYGATYFAQNFSCVKGNTKIVLKDTLNNRDIEIPIEEVYEILYE